MIFKSVLLKKILLSFQKLNTLYDYWSPQINRVHFRPRVFEYSAELYLTVVRGWQPRRFGQSKADSCGCGLGRLRGWSGQSVGVVNIVISLLKMHKFIGLRRRRRGMNAKIFMRCLARCEMAAPVRRVVAGAAPATPGLLSVQFYTKVLF